MYCDRETLDVSCSRGQSELSSSLQFTVGCVRNEEHGTCIDVIKEQKQSCEEMENVKERKIDTGGDIFKSELVFCAESENAAEKDSNKLNRIKIEEICYEENETGVNKENNFEVEDHKLLVNDINIFKSKSTFCADKENATEEECNKLNGIKIEETFYGENEACVKEENLFEIEEHKFSVGEEIDIKTDEYNFNRFGDGVEGDVSCTKHASINKNGSKIAIYQCEYCAFQTKYKHSLKKHLLKHTDPSQITTYECHCCSFKTKVKRNFNRHLLIHKDPSEISMYKCDSCPFQTRRKDHHKAHLLVHKKRSEVIMFKCDSCSFQTKHKGSLIKHLVLHESPSRVTMYKCNSCSFQTKHKFNLKIHLLMHKSPSEVTMYKCDVCSYQSRNKPNLRKHLRTVH